jgi:hypothetical protein
MTRNEHEANAALDLYVTREIPSWQPKALPWTIKPESF